MMEKQPIKQAERYPDKTRPTLIDKQLYEDFKAECKKRKTSVKDEMESLMVLYILGVIDGNE